MTGLEGKLKKARALGSEGRYHESLDILKALHKEQSENVQVLFLAGASFFKLGDFEKARTAWEKVLSVDPGHAKAKEWLAKVPGGLAAESVPADSPSQPGGGEPGLSFLGAERLDHRGCRTREARFGRSGR